MADEQKVVVRFETSQAPTPSTDASETLLMSGPIDVFATADYLEELNSEENLEVFEEAFENQTVIVYVKNVTNVEEEIYSRGAYFRLEGIFEDDYGQKYPKWQEILLGTHSHHNINILEEISSLDYYAEDFPENGKMLIAKPNGEFELQDVHSFDSSLLLPELPENVKAELLRREKLKNLLPGIEFPEDSEYHHLDAPLDELVDTYDWKNYENGQYLNLAVGNCRDLYYALVRAGKYLFIDEDLNLSIGEMDTSKSWLQLHADAIIYDPKNTDLNDSFIHTTERNGKLFFKMHLPVEVVDGDEVFLFSGEKHQVFCNSDIVVVAVDNTNKEITFAVSKTASQIVFEEPQLLNLIVAKNVNNLFRIDFLKGLENEKISLEIIESSLLKAYTAGVISQQINLPHLYLTTDDNGNVHWENTLIPTQTFYNATEFVEVSETPEDILLEFKGTQFKAKYDFPILIIDGAIDFTTSYNIKPSGNLVYKLSGDFLERYAGEKVRIDLIIIRKSSGGSLAEELAQNYISKKDAVEILSRGKLNLEEYAKKSELSKLAKLNHKHSQYALKEHVHDSRYAMFHHTHPELYAVVAKITGGEVTDADIEKWVQEIQDNNESQLVSVLEELGVGQDENGNFIIPDGSINVEQSIIDDLNTKIKRDNIGIGEIEAGANLDTVLATIVTLFEHDKVLDDQVELSDDIIVKYDIGGIKAGTVYHGRRVAETNNVGEEYTPDTLRKILTDMLNPFIDTAEVIKIMTPVNVKLEWYVSDGGEGSTYTKVNPLRILESMAVNEYNESRLYFKILGGINIYGKDCESYTSTATGVPGGLQKTRVFIEGDNHEYHYYDGNPKDIKDITFSWDTTYSTLNPNVEENQEVKGIIWDNYGIKYEVLNPDKNTHTITPEIKYGYPAIYIKTDITSIAEGELADDNFTVILKDYSDYKMSFLDKPIMYRCDMSNDRRFILLAVRRDIYENGDIMIRNMQTGNRVECFFWETGDIVEISGEYYYPLTYEVYSDLYQRLDLELSLLKMEGNEDDERW